MVHPFFQKLRENAIPCDESFKERFHIIFLQDDLEYANVSSWLDVIESHFPWGEVSAAGLIPQPYLEQLKQGFINFGFSAEQSPQVFYFWALINWIHLKLQEIRYIRDDKIFGFMKDQRINDVQVVIIGNEPHEIEWSSGSAFHKSVCFSTKQMVDFLKEEINLVCERGAQTPLNVDDEYYENVKATCDLGGWIQQHVLLLNRVLTYSEGENLLSPAWKIVTKFFIQHLNDSKEHLVFILLGREVRGNTEMLISESRHFRLILHHPGYYGDPYREWDWRAHLPFLNTNLYLYQTPNRSLMVDWQSVSTISNEKENRLRQLESLFASILQEPSGTWRGLNIIRNGGFVYLQKP